MTTLLGRRPIVAGALIGLGWGVAMRAWMHYISTDREFSWGGTLFIVGASVIVGTVLGVARSRRQSGGAGWWRLSLASLLLLGAGGAVMWPAVILGGIAIGRPRPAALRWVLGLGAAATQIPVITDAILDNWRFSATDKVLATTWYLPMLALEALAFSVAFAPAVEGARMPRRVVAVLTGAGVVGFAFFAVLVMGISM